MIIAPTDSNKYLETHQLLLLPLNPFFVSCAVPFPPRPPGKKWKKYTFTHKKPKRHNLVKSKDRMVQRGLDIHFHLKSRGIRNLMSIDGLNGSNRTCILTSLSEKRWKPRDSSDFNSFLKQSKGKATPYQCFSCVKSKILNHWMTQIIQSWWSISPVVTRQLLVSHSSPCVFLSLLAHKTLRREVSSPQSTSRRENGNRFGGSVG